MNGSADAAGAFTRGLGMIAIPTAAIAAIAAAAPTRHPKPMVRRAFPSIAVETRAPIHEGASMSGNARSAFVNSSCSR